MLILDPTHVRMNAKADDKNEALRIVAQLLADEGLADSEYLAGLITREGQSNTYLGQGIAIPHGTPESREHIKQTGVRVVHFPDGITWNDEGDVVYVAVAISAKSDEHLGILKSLTQALGADVEDLIKNAQSADEIVAILTGQVLSSKSLILHENLIKTKLNVNDIDGLYQYTVNLLKEKQILGSCFVQTNLTPLTKDVWCATLTGGCAKKSAVAITVANKTMQHQGVPVHTLMTVVNADDIDLDRLSYVYDCMLDSSFSTKLPELTTTQIAEQIGAELSLDWKVSTAIILNEHGLHARPATILSDIAKTATGQIKVALEDGCYVSAKSLTRLLSLGATHGQELTFIAEPNTDAVDVLQKVIKAVNQGLGETVVPINNAKIADKLIDELAQKSKLASMIIEKGKKAFATPASSGFAVGQAYVIKDVQFKYEMMGDNPSHEWKRLQDAINDVKDELNDTIQNAKSASIAQIFTAHLALLDDTEITHGAKDGIDNGMSAEASWATFIEHLVKVQSSVSNHVLAERAMDLKDVGQKVLAKLTGQTLDNPPSEPYVLIKDELLPSDVAKLDAKDVLGILTAQGGASSHSAIVARSLGIPCVVGAGTSVLDVANGEMVLIDGKEGSLVIAPDDELVKTTQQKQEILRQKQAHALEHCQKPAITKDGHRVEIAVNIGNVNDTADAVAKGAEAVGLLRTELVFMAHTKVPNIETQMVDYTKVFEALDGRPLVVRTLDVGGDKPLPYLPMPAEENPFLGVRGIRLSLQEPTLFKNQLIALIRASKGQDLRIMFPMIGRFEEWQQAKAILDEVRAEYPHDKLQVGIMVEVPSVAILADDFAKEVDFFSIGTNDLTQYTLAIDRGHSTISKDADGLHPSVLQLIKFTVDSAHAHGKWVGVCGELAGDEMAVPILLGLGVDELSMSKSSIPITKELVRGLDLTACQELAKKALRCRSANEVRALTGV
ncbi:phosphoenolpyruvate--protein phosphotransferase [Moraxella oblonga]|uniref:phosphoenolpyruvate--protein phosphotransferase n=1 Tax=Moraxella oblonga TaxID=200413 RepID=UPI00082D05D0|nr:phosphoenolpyruvate--protein phosphotransferase [Moraxella oblonga]